MELTQTNMNMSHSFVAQISYHTESKQGFAGKNCIDIRNTGILFLFIFWSDMVSSADFLLKRIWNEYCNEAKREATHKKPEWKEKNNKVCIFF